MTGAPTGVQYEIDGDYLVHEFLRHMEDYSALEKRANDWLRNEMMLNLPAILEKIELFKQYLYNYIQLLKNKTRKILINIRFGREEANNCLSKLLDRINDEKFTFNSNRLNIWLNEKQQEFYKVKQISDEIKNGITKKSRNSLDLLDNRFVEFPKSGGVQQEMLQANVKYGFQFTFTSLEDQESLLDEMETHIKNYVAFEAAIDGPLTADAVNQEFWFSDQSIIDQIDKNKNAFITLINHNMDVNFFQEKCTDLVFAITALNAGEETKTHKARGSAIFVYKRGNLQKEKEDVMRVLKERYPKEKWNELEGITVHTAPPHVLLSSAVEQR